MRWNPKLVMEPLVPVVVTSAELASDMNPRHLRVVVSRVHHMEKDDNALELDIHQHNDISIPHVTMQKTGEEVVWTLCSRTIVRGASQSGVGAEILPASVISTSQDILSAFARPLRFMSYAVQKGLSQMPSVSAKDKNVLGNYLRKDIRTKTPCTLLEWESIVQHVVRRLCIPVHHEPEYDIRDVPRYDIEEMTLFFPTLHGLLRLFRHLTLGTLRNMVYKEKGPRRQRGSKSARHSQTVEGPDLVQLIGEFVSQRGVFAFTIGSCFYPKANLSPRFLYPVLFRESDEWNNLDRMFVHELDIKLLDIASLTALQEQREEDNIQSRKGSRKRIRETFLGLKWVRDSKHDFRALRFHSFNADDIQGTLHLCVPSVVFVGRSYAPQIKALVSTASGIFDLR